VLCGNCGHQALTVAGFRISHSWPTLPAILRGDASEEARLDKFDVEAQLAAGSRP
jgi:hypothetical protein